MAIQYKLSLRLTPSLYGLVGINKWLLQAALEILKLVIYLLVVQLTLTVAQVGHPELIHLLKIPRQCKVV
jgi:hypothetical protein